MRAAMRITAALVLAFSFCNSALAAEKKELLIGLIPEENIFRQIERNMPLAGYICRKTGISIKFTILSRYGDIIDAFVTRDMDGAFFGAFTGYLAHVKLGVVPLVRPVGAEGGTVAQSIIFVRKDSGIRDVRQFRHKSAVFVDKATATGFIYLLCKLRGIGVHNVDGFFREYYFTGNQESSVYSVLDRRADVGVAKSRYFEKLAAKDPLVAEELLVIARSEKLPDTVLCLRKDMDPLIRQKLMDVLVGMKKDPEGQRVLHELGYSGFTASKVSDFDPVAKLSREAGIDIRTYRYTR
ncbi:MAG: phosphate/phosphite/phosphonate ABC transporter substrate-binding protein [Nitrospiraceae bacterium]|nr:phosphate/phosphite/phosphonate ABC transporter substrate-binding protein [Nitrospiraceae bacterium]